MDCDFGGAGVGGEEIHFGGVRLGFCPCYRIYWQGWGFEFWKGKSSAPSDDVFDKGGRHPVPVPRFCFFIYLS